jgi:hypothetical protein
MQIADAGHFPRGRKLRGVDLLLDGHDVAGHVHLCEERGGEKEPKAEKQPGASGGRFAFAQTHGIILAPQCNKSLMLINSVNEQMANVIFLRLDPRSAGQLGPLLEGDGHEIHVERENAPVGLIRDSSAVFIGGVAESYLPVLRRLRALDANLCVVVIARMADTQDWLNVIEAGATDYWPAPFEASQVRMLIPPVVSLKSIEARSATHA